MTTNSKASISPVNQFLDLNNKLVSSDNIDEIFSIALEELQAIFLTPWILFAVIFDNEAIIEAKLGDYKGIKSFKFEKRDLKKFSKHDFIIENDLIFIPICLQNKLIGLIITKIDLKKIDQDFNHAIKNFSEIFSKLISEKQIIADLKLINENLLNQDKHKSALISTVSHELRTPLTNIIGYSELLTKLDYDETRTKYYLNEIYLASLRLSNMISNYLDLSRLEAHSSIQLENFEKNEIDWIAERTWESLSFINQNHELMIQKEGEITEIECDSEAISRVFTNLFSNAIKYSKPLIKLNSEAAKLICKITPKKKYIEISIIDNGIGIDSKDLDKLFEKFSRIQSKETELIAGSGLGLWICKEIIEAHGGKIYCESEKGKYTNFTFTLPKGNNIKR